MAELLPESIIEQDLVRVARATLDFEFPRRTFAEIRHLTTLRLRLPPDHFSPTTHPARYYRSQIILAAEFRRARVLPEPLQRCPEKDEYDKVNNSFFKRQTLDIDSDHAMPLVKRKAREPSASSSDEDDVRPKKVAKRFISNEFIDTDSDDSDAGGKPAPKKSTPIKAKVGSRTPKRPVADVDGTDSDLSSDVIDEPLSKPKKRNGAFKPVKSVKNEQNSKSSSVKADKSSDPAAAEIKELQGWLVKCGVRKVWSKELAPYESSSAKVRHLKELLDNVGMSGKFSVAKAARIKEQRELAAELEDVQQNEKKWGEDVDVSRNGGRAQRAAARGPRRKVMSESSSSEEESDQDAAEVEDEEDEEEKQESEESDASD